MSDDKTLRSFLAIDPPETVRDAMGRIQDRLKKNLTGMIRWAAPAGIHLTLKFFGDIAPENIVRISAAIQEDIAGTAPLALEIRTLGVFPDARRPRVIWLGTAGETDRLQKLRAKLDHSFAKLGFPEENRPFLPHWTLGRIKSPTGLADMSRIIDTNADITAGPFWGKTLTLFQSNLTPKGAVYTKLAEYPLNG